MLSQGKERKAARSSYDKTKSAFVQMAQQKAFEKSAKSKSERKSRQVAETRGNTTKAETDTGTEESESEEGYTQLNTSTMKSGKAPPFPTDISPLAPSKGPKSKGKPDTESSAKRGKSSPTHSTKRGGGSSSKSPFGDMLKKTWVFITRLEWKVLLFIGILIFGCIALKLGEESYSESNEERREKIDKDYYKTLDIKRSATKQEIEKSYRKLSRLWHPDKNIGCESCEAKFTELSEAYAVLSDKERRTAYDGSASDFEAIQSITTTLTDDNFRSTVLNSLRKNEVWVTQIYTDIDGLCRHVAPLWEEAALSQGDYVNFGRINAKKEKRALKLVPLKIRFFPTIIMFIAEQQPLIYPGVYGMTQDSLIVWIESHYPNAAQRLYQRSQFLKFIAYSTWSPPIPSENGTSALYQALSISNSRRPRLLIVSSTAKLPLAFRALAYRWRGVFDFGHTLSADVAKAGLSDAWGLGKGNEVELLLFDETVHQLKSLEEDSNSSSMNEGEVPMPISKLKVSRRSTAEELRGHITRLQRATLPWLSSQTSHLLCSSPIQRVYCVVHINSPPRLIGESSKVAADVYRHSAPAPECEKDASDSSLCADGRDEAYMRDVQRVVTSRPRQLPRWIVKLLGRGILSGLFPRFRCLELWESEMADVVAFVYDREGKRFFPFRVHDDLETTRNVLADVGSGDSESLSQLGSVQLDKVDALLQCNQRVSLWYMVRHALLTKSLWVAIAIASITAVFVYLPN